MLKSNKKRENGITIIALTITIIILLIIAGIVINVILEDDGLRKKIENFSDKVQETQNSQNQQITNSPEKLKNTINE